MNFIFLTLFQAKEKLWCVKSLGWRRVNGLQVEAMVCSGSGFRGGQIQHNTSRRLAWSYRKLKLEYLPVVSESPSASGAFAIGLSNVISLSVHVCVCFKHSL